MHVAEPRPGAGSPGPPSSALLAVLLALLFVAEVLVLVAVAWWSVSLGGALGVVVAVALVSLMAVLWGRFAAPRASGRLRGAVLGAFMLAWFAVGGLCLAALGHPWWGGALVGGFVATKALLGAAGHGGLARNHA